MGDRFTVRLVVAGLALLSLGSVVFMGFLALDEKTIPTELVSVSSATIGALAAMLAKTSVDEPNSVVTTSVTQADPPNMPAAPVAPAPAYQPGLLGGPR